MRGLTAGQLWTASKTQIDTGKGEHTMKKTYFPVECTINPLDCLDVLTYSNQTIDNAYYFNAEEDFFWSASPTSPPTGNQQLGRS